MRLTIRWAQMAAARGKMSRDVFWFKAGVNIYFQRY